MIYFHSIWKETKNNLWPAGDARFKNTYTCLYIYTQHLGIFIFISFNCCWPPLLLNCFISPRSSSRPPRVVNKIKGSSFPDCIQLLLPIWPFVVFQLTKLYFCLGPQHVNSWRWKLIPLWPKIHWAFGIMKLLLVAVSPLLAANRCPNRCSMADVGNHECIYGWDDGYPLVIWRPGDMALASDIDDGPQLW